MRKAILFPLVAGVVAAAPVAVVLGQTSAPPPAAAVRENQPKVRTGPDAFADWEASAPGVLWRIQAKDLPKPFASESARNAPQTAPWREGIVPKVPDGFRVALFAQGLEDARTIRVAPNGDVFVAESKPGRIKVFRADSNGQGAGEVFAEGLNNPYGLAFYPAKNPRFLYVGETNRVVRFAYSPETRKATGTPEVIIGKLPSGGHSTRDIAFSPDDQQMYVAVGSASNVAEGLPPIGPEELKTFEQRNGVGASWGPEEGRATVMVSDPDGKNLKSFANGIRNCSGLAIESSTGAPWCATNERDGLGDDVPPDYVTRVQQGGFYGWPWYYIGTNPDPRQSANPRPELSKYVVAPDVLIQAHSAPLGLAFYNGKMFPEEYSGDAFVTLHGSWNRGKRTGYKVVRLLFENGQPTGVYEDFMTGFVVDERSVWGRPTGVAVAADGALLVSEDEAGTIWRVSR